MLLVLQDLPFSCSWILILKHISSHWFEMLGVSREDSVSTSNGRGVSQADGTHLRGHTRWQLHGQGSR